MLAFYHVALLSFSAITSINIHLNNSAHNAQLSKWITRIPVPMAIIAFFPLRSRTITHA